MSSTKMGFSPLGAIRGIGFMRFRELASPKSLLRIGGIALGCLGLLMLLRLDPDTATERFEGLVVGSFILKFLPLYCLTKGGEALRRELKDGTIEYLWVRQVSKAELFAGLYVSSLMSVLALVGPVLLGVVLAALFLGAFGLPAVCLLGATALAAIASFTALSNALAAYSSKFVVLGILFFSFVELGLARLPNGAQQVALTFHCDRLLQSIGQSGSGIDWNAFAWIFAIGAFAFGVGTLVFSRAHYAGKGEKES